MQMKKGGRKSIKREDRVEKAIPVLIGWYRENRRELPFRADPTPFHIWLSEIMLQQTRIEAALPYYARFLAEVPDIASLAALPDERLMKLWQGLGYYSRARNLKKAAQTVCERFGGELPADAALLKKLPGIGDYTAGAIASIAFGLPTPAVDGNVLRVMTRLLACPDDITLPETRKKIALLLSSHYPVGKEAGLLTEGLMELGESVCIPNGEARCNLCPLAFCCEAREKDKVNDFPVKAEKKERRIEEKTVLLLSCGDRFAIEKRPPGKLLADLWQFPLLDGAYSGEEITSFLAGKGIKAEKISPCGKARHIFTHIEWKMTGFRVECFEKDGTFLWKTPSEIRDEYAIPSAFRYFRKQILAESAEKS